MDTPTRAEPGALLADPSEIRRAWMDLRSRHAHVHGPQAAQMLGVPEAALIASCVGRGAVALGGHLGDLLAEAGRWGKLLVAVRNGLGVGLFIVDDAQVLLEGDRVELRSSTHELLLDAAERQAFYLFEDHDAHGRTYSINGFDGQGDVVARVFLMSKSGRELAQPWLQGFARAEQSPRWQGWAQACGLSRLDEPLVVQQTHGDPASAAALTQRCIRAVGALGRQSVDVVFEGRGAAARATASGLKGSETAGAVHVTHAGYKLHLSLGSLARAEHVQHRDGRLGLRVVDKDGGRLSLLCSGDPSQVLAWLRGHASEDSV